LVTCQAHNLKIVGSSPILAKFVIITMALNISTHWYELKIRAVYFLSAIFFSMACFFFNGDIILYFFVKIFLMENLNKTFIFTNLNEGFFSYIFISIFCSACVTLPIGVYLSFDFLKNGFFKKEKDLFIFFIKNSMILSATSFLITHNYFLPLCIKFFLSFEQANSYIFFQLHMQPKIFDYVVLNVSFFIGFFLLFHLPIILSILININFISLSSFYKNRRMLILGCFIVGCIFSPPDIFSQIIVAIPMWFFSESIIFYNFIIKYYILNEEGWLGR
jgi:sec-independent protein translocase protein TatC